MDNWQRATPFGWLTAYYLTIGLTLWFVLIWIPDLVTFLPIGGLSALEIYGIDLVTGSVAASDLPNDPWAAALKLTISLFATLLLMLPVAWVYLGSRRRRAIRQGFLVAIILMPVAVTGMILIVQFSLAIAFGLVGIVAALRFRTELREAADAVYIFTAIGVGIASGISAIGIGAVMSTFFNYLVLLLWYANIGQQNLERRYFARTWMKENPTDDSTAKPNYQPDAR